MPVSYTHLAEDIHPVEGGTAFTLVDAEYGRFAVTIPTVGRHTVYDALAAYAAARDVYKRQGPYPQIQHPAQG